MRAKRLLLVGLLIAGSGCGDDGGGPTPDGPPGGGPDGAAGGPDGAPGTPDGGGQPSCVPVEGTPALARETIGDGFDRPVYATSPPGDPRIFVVEQNGSIKIIKDGQVLPEDFLFVQDTQHTLSGGDERGLLGMAFHPDYATNGRFYVFFMTDDPDHVVEEYTVSSNPDVADPSSAQEVLRYPDVAGNHNGGMIAFGPNDGYLYVSIGDGGGAGDTMNRGQTRTELFGNLLRIDVDTLPYTIPASNPYAGSTTDREEIWAYGLRNPWRFSFDRETGDLYIGDVGQGTWEEIDVQPASSTGGENYGWRVMEGAHCYNAATCNTTDKVLPVYEYSHNDGCSVVGGYVYRGCRMPGYHGTYFFADYCSGWVRSFRWDGANGFTNEQEWADLSGGDLTSFGEDGNGEILITNFVGGRVYRIVPQ